MSAATGTDPEYTIVVPAYNEERLLPATLESLREAMAQVHRAGEIVVCDNNSTDRTAEIARGAGARVVFEGENQISRARNTGARAARGRWLVWIDADTRMPAGLLREAVERMASGRVAGGGSTLRMAGRPGRLLSWFVRGWTWLSTRWGLAAGAFVFARRDAFEQVGGFSEKVYASEEIWFSRAVARWGRERDMSFDLLTDHPVVTSPRKAEWYPSVTFVVVLFLFALFPFLTRSRRFCFLWYRRPGSAGRAGSS